ncbi:MAG: gliding motility-associated C-terminal domain-containing protein [Bacteroidetes bacterium]|nr:gliding motility-associated C-terminal domain-containing protein [Bacteroidota bacterium]
MGAIPICQNVYTQNSSFTGPGVINELNATNQGCLTTGENNSVWYIINAATTGTLIFTITPLSPSDYDFAVWDLTDKSCDAISSGLVPIRCNYASFANSTPGGLTGLSTTSSTASIGAGGGSFSSAINAIAGQTYTILINNASASTAGYTIDFTGSTCQILDNVAPIIKSDSITASCTGPSNINILLSENVVCSSFANDGSDFVLSPSTASIISANSSVCSAGGSFANLFTLDFSAPLTPGNYVISIATGTDGNTLIDNCGNPMAVGNSISFVILPAVQAAISTQFGCAGTPSGVINVSNIGGNPPFTYKLNAGSFTTNNNFTGLYAGNYTITIKDNNGCTDDTIVNLMQGPDILFNSVVVSDLICYGYNTGSVVVSASGGTPPIQYAINTSAYSASNSFTNLAPGNYIIHAKDAIGCIKDTLIFISSPGQISIASSSITNASCNVNNGSITVNAFGGVLPLNFSLNAGPYQLTPNFSNLASGMYVLHIKDANNCTKDTTITISQISAVVINSLNVIQPTCSGNTGSINVIGSGGVTPYSYSMNGTTFTTSNTFSLLASGTYTITMKDAGGCTATSTTTLSSPVNLFFTNTSVTIPTCVIQGSITTNGLGGALPYQFAINTGSYGSTNTFTSLVPGTYTIHLQDNNGCSHDTIISIPGIPLPSFDSLQIINASCSFPNSGIVTAFASGGTAPLTYSINGGSFGASPVFSNLSGGTYTVLAKDANGCTVSSVANITSFNTLVFDFFDHTNVGCGGTPLANIVAVVIGGNPSYQFSLNGGPYQASGIFTGVSGGLYTVTAMDASGCTATTVTFISNSSSLSITSVNTSNSPCAIPPTGSISISGNGTAPPITYSLNGATTIFPGNYNNLPPGTYTISAYDVNGCHVDSVVTIAGNPPLYFSNPIVVHPPCSGGYGSISLQGIGGLPPYNFSLNSGSFTPVSNWPVLIAGTYTIQLQDANGCLHDTIIYLIDPPAIDITSTFVSNASCTGAATGSISVTPLNGTPPFLYSLNGGTLQSSPSYTGLGPGNYALHVTDSSGCGADTSFVINSGGNFTIIDIDLIQPLCFGDLNGSISFGAIGGLAPYQFALNGSAFSTNNNFTGLSSASYTLHAKDNSGCFKDSVIMLGEPLQVGFSSIQIISPMCFGEQNASVTCVGSGGVSPYQFQLDGGAINTLGNFSNLFGGWHTLTVIDANNCTKDSIIQITQPALLGFSNINITQPGCLGSVGQITISGGGGISPYNYAIGSSAYSATNTFTNLPIGLYTFYVKDANNCENDTIISVVQNPLISLNSVNHTPVLCPGSTTGFINATATSIAPPISYSLNGGAPQSTANFTNLPAGTHWLHVQDQAGCYIDSNIIIESAPPIQINNVLVSMPLCFGSADGSVQVNAIGGLGSLQFSINTGSYSNNNLFTNLAAGTYTMHIKDSLLCLIDTTVLLSSPSPLYFASINLINPYCSNATDGSISINAAGGQPPYLYKINTSLYTTNNTFQNLFQGIYTVYVKDITGCIHDTVINLPSSNYMNFSNVVITDVNCKYGNDGTISLGVTGGFSPYQFSINSVSTGASSMFGNLATGSYTIIATDIYGCEADTIITVNEPATPLMASILNITHNVCRGDSIGSITATAFGGTSPYAYSINGSSFQTSPNFTGLFAGTYLVLVKDFKGCLEDTIAIVLEPDTSAQLELISIKDVSCFGVNDGEIIVSSNYGIEPIAYYFNGTMVALDTLYDNLNPGNYIIEVKDSMGCISTGKFVVKPSDLRPYIIIDSIEEILCKGDRDGAIDWHTINTYPPYYYTFDSIYIDTVSYMSGITNGLYLIQVTDSRGCYADTLVPLVEGDSLDLDIVSIPAICSGLGDDGQADAVVIGGEAPFKYNWSGAPGNFTSHANNLLFGEHTAMVTDNLGCIDTAHFEVEYDPCCLVSLPNAFSPNQDGKNDIFKAIIFGEITLVSFEIYNRWGNMLFSTVVDSDGWDGKQNGTESDVGTYFYILRYKCHMKNETIMLKGDVTLIR